MLQLWHLEMSCAYCFHATQQSHTFLSTIALGFVDPLVASAPSLASPVAVHVATLGELVDDEIPLPLYILSCRSGNGNFHFETATT